MLRKLLGFAIFAVIAIFLIKVFLGLFGLLIGFLVTIAWFAFVGFLIYLVLKVIAPDTAARVREMIAGRPAIYRPAASVRGSPSPEHTVRAHRNARRRLSRSNPVRSEGSARTAQAVRGDPSPRSG